MDSAIGRCDGPQTSDRRPNPTTRAEPPNAPVTVAVKVTGLPWCEGFKDDARVVLVCALFTVWVSAADLLPRFLLLPP